MDLNFLKVGIAIAVLGLIDFIIEFFIIRKIKDKRKSIKYRVALRYILVFCLIFFMAKIWVEGFGYFLTVIGVVAAALTITQKEYLMNFVGWLIIMWRDLFVEGDFIEIGKHTGYVTYLGPMYFFVEETFEGDRTGRLIKLHNSIIANNPVVNYSLDRSFIEGRQYFIFDYNTPQMALQGIMDQIENDLLRYIDQLNEDRHHRLQREYASQKSKGPVVQCILRVVQEREKALGLQLKVRYYALKQDQKKINDRIFALIKSAIDQDPEVQLSEVI